MAASWIKATTMRESQFDALRDRGGLQAGHAYVVREEFGPLTVFGFSPDGEGVIWYSTMVELLFEHE